MGVYIRYLAEPIVQVGGTVANEAMIADGWFYYDGPVPNGDPLALIDGVLVPFEQTKGVGSWMNPSDRYLFCLNYLKSTDHKFLSDYTPVEGEDLEAIKKLRAEYREVVREYIKLYLTPYNGEPTL